MQTDTAFIKQLRIEEILRQPDRMADVIGYARQIFFVGQILPDNQESAWSGYAQRLAQTDNCITNVVQDVDHDDEIEVIRCEGTFLDRMIIDQDTAALDCFREPSSPKCDVLAHQWIAAEDV